MAKHSFPRDVTKVALLTACFLACGQPLAAASTAAVAQLPTEQDAPIALLVDLTSGQTLFARQADRRFAPASIAKVMTAYTAFEQIKQGKISLTQSLPVRPATFAQWSRVGSTMYLPNGARPSVNQLLMGITTVSANDGAVVLAEGAAGSVAEWLRLMNGNARALGMRDSRFGTPNGWPDGGETYTTARDLVKLAQATVTRHPQLYKAYFGHRTFTFNGITQRNHDPITGRVPGADGLKTGYTDAAGFGFLGSAERDGRRLAMVVAASDTSAARDRSARALMEWGFTRYEAHRLLPARQPIAEAEVQGGAMRSVGLVTGGPLTITTLRGTAPAVRMKVRYDGPLQAPLQRGVAYASLEVRVDGMPPYTVPLLAAQDVPAANALQRTLNGAIGWIS